MHEEKKAYLREIRVLNKLICTYEEELLEHRLISGCAPIGCYEQIARGPSNNEGPVAPAVLKILEYEEKIKNTIVKYIDKKSKCLDAIEALKDPVEKLVLRLRYINGKSHDETAEIIEYSKEQEKRICNNALKKFKIPES